MNTELRELSINEIEMIKRFFAAVFTQEPWNDDWSDEEQLHAYIMDLIGNRNSLAFGLFENDTMVGLSMGEIRHWFTGTEYFINEFCIKTEEQGRGLGSQFLAKIGEHIKAKGITHMFLLTDNDVPAFQFYQKNGFCHLKNSVALFKEC